MPLNIEPKIAAAAAELTAIRRDIHAHPELGFEEERTSQIVAKKLKEWGCEVTTGIGKTGVVGTIRVGNNPTAIGLRADMDALPMDEYNTFDHRSQHKGRMHACGHDGHTTMLLGAAQYLSATRNFDGTVHFIFQPAEENEGGAERMVADGLFRRFPVEAIFGMHNWPALPLGRAGLTTGPMMAAFGIFEIEVKGRGAHGAMPHQGADPVAAVFQIGSALQTIAARNVSPMSSAVVSVTTVHGGDAWNVIPDACRMSGTVRWFAPEIGDLIETRLKAIVHGIAEAMGCTATIDYQRRYPATINDAAEARFVQGVIRDMAPTLVLEEDIEPSMGAEDFAFMLLEKPGAYVWVGQGRGTGDAGLHSPRYDFNDAALPIGADLWTRIAEARLAKA